MLITHLFILDFKMKARLFITVFLVLLLIPNVVLLFGLESNLETNENLKHATFPKIEINKPTKTLSAINSFYTGNFGLKKTAVNQYIYFKRAILKEDPLPNYMVTGKDNWYFLGNQYNNVFKNTFGVIPSEKPSKILSYLNTVNQYLSDQNIKFYVVVVPDKHQIYKEYLPYTLPQGTTLLNLVKQNASLDSSHVKFIDLHKSLLNKKEQHQIYYKTDSHWDNLGAFYGYKTLMQELENDFAITSLNKDDFNITTSLKTIGDNTKMTNLKQEVNFVTLEPKSPNKIDVVLDDQNYLHFKNNSKTLNLLMYRDSFTNALTPFLNQTFNNVILVRDFNVAKSHINKHNPDIVILEIAERNLDYLSRATLK